MNFYFSNAAFVTFPRASFSTVTVHYLLRTICKSPVTTANYVITCSRNKQHVLTIACECCV